MASIQHCFKRNEPGGLGVGVDGSTPAIPGRATADPVDERRDKKGGLKMEHGTIPLSTGYDLCNRDGGCLSRRVFLKGVGIACLGFIPLLQACDAAFSREGEEGTRSGAVPARRAMRPPIDVSAPEETRTATFGLG